MTEFRGTFASDIAALFRDPGGVTELRDALPTEDDTTLSSAVFLTRCAGRSSEDVLDPRCPDSPGNLIAAARWVAITAMAEPWLGAVRTWHETRPAVPGKALEVAAEHALYWRLAGGWPVEFAALQAHLAAWPITDAEHEAVESFAQTLLDADGFAYTFDGAVARVAEIAERAALNQLVLRLTLPGRPILYPEDATGQAELWPPTGESGTPQRDRTEMLSALGELEPDGTLVAVTTLAETPDDRVCCFMRGDRLLVAVTVGDRATGACGWQLPPEAAGSWRDVLSGRTHELPDSATLAAVLGPDGRAVLVRQ
jgi:(1->4)-alpha-D-glucan 1-alpha-D-glucosylmutase